MQTLAIVPSSPEHGYELVIKPPSFRITGGQCSPDGKCWYADALFDTPKGPVTISVSVKLPEAFKTLYEDIKAALTFKHAAKRVVAGWGGIPGQGDIGDPTMSMGDDAAGWGFHLPNPMKVVRGLSRGISKAARKAANSALAGMSGAARLAAHAAMMTVKAATNPAELKAALADAAHILGSVKIPGLPIPLAALNPIGAAMLAAKQVIGPDLTRSILSKAVNGMAPGMGDTAADMAMNAMSGDEGAGDDSGDDNLAGEISAQAAEMASKILSGAMKKSAMKSMVKKKAIATAKVKANDPRFAKEMGIPTLSVKPEYYGAARKIIPILRGLHRGDPKAKAAIAKLGNQVANGKTPKERAEARTVWLLAAQISEQALASHKRSNAIARGEIMAGDGYGDGYGVRGYSPPPSPMAHAFAQLHG